jgi:flagella basal body P-ring formation protein FlgA
MTPTKDSASLNTISLLGPYVPRRSALAQFTKYLGDYFAGELGWKNTIVLAVDDKTGAYAYPEDVRMHVYANARKDYRAAADMLNINDIDVCLIQHDVDLYGGADGALILELLRRLRMPTMCVLHTVRAKPTDGQSKVMAQIIQLCDRLIVTTEKDESALKKVYGASASKIALVPPSASRALSKAMGETARQKLAGKYLQIASDVVGKKVWRPVAKGACVKTWHVRAHRNMQRGDAVVIVAASGAIRVEAPGRLLESGNPGDRVRVLNNASGKEVYATVVDSKTVTVPF